MRIVHLAYSLNPTQDDPVKWLKYLAFYTGILESMARHEEVININFINCNSKIEANGVTHYFFKGVKIQQIFPFRVHRFIKSLNPDVVIVHGLIYPWQILLLRFQLGNDVRIIVQHHAEKPLRLCKSQLQKLADQYIAAYFFSSQQLAVPWISAGQIKDPVKIHEVMEVSSVFHPIEKQHARLVTRVKGEKIYLWVGRLDSNKDPLLVIRAFIQFQKLYPHAKLLMIFQTAELIHEINVILDQNPDTAEFIQLVGKVDRDQLLYWYNSSDFIISSSHYEGSGVSVCEAMSCGCIPILTSIPSFIMMTENGGCGLLYPPGNEDALLQVFMKSILLDHVSERNKVIKQFNENLSFKAIGDKILRVISSRR